MVGAGVASDQGEMAWVVWEVDVFDEGIDEGPQRMIGEVSVGVDWEVNGVLGMERGGGRCLGGVEVKGDFWM